MTALPTDQAPSALRVQRGFTLIELMIIVALMGIFVAIAVPSFTQFINKNRSQSFNNELNSLLQYARATAVDQRTFMRVCKGDKVWTVQQNCSSGDSLRSLEIPASLTLNSSTNAVLFRFNGTGADTRLITCYNGDYANGFTTEIKASGSIQSWPRGYKASTVKMTACDK